jgi:hypothetical protein
MELLISFSFPYLDDTIDLPLALLTILLLAVVMDALLILSLK